MISWLNKQALILFLMAATSVSGSLFAEEENSAEQKLKPLMYFEIEPNILTFYQGMGKKIGYVVVQVNIAVRGQESFDLVELHKPLIQDKLIDFFNQQDKSVIQPFKERDKLRLQAKAAVVTVLKEETGKELIEDLLFTNYVYQ